MSDAAAATVVDPDGRAVALTEERWAHITDGHAELAHFRDEVLETVRAPDKRLAGPTPGEAWFYSRVSGRVGGSRSSYAMNRSSAAGLSPRSLGGACHEHHGWSHNV
jgi:hypothetical protein